MVSPFYTIYDFHHFSVKDLQDAELVLQLERFRTKVQKGRIGSYVFENRYRLCQDQIDNYLFRCLVAKGRRRLNPSIAVPTSSSWNLPGSEFLLLHSRWCNGLTLEHNSGKRGEMCAYVGSFTLALDEDFDREKGAM